MFTAAATDLIVAACLATAFVGGILRGATGFGSALVMAPILSAMLGPQVAVPLTILMGLAGSILLFPQYRNEVEFGLVGSIGAVGLLFIFPGVLLLNVVDAELMRRLIAILVFSIAGSMLIFGNIRFESRSAIIDRAGIVLASALGGVVMGSTGMGGPPVVTYLAGREGSAKRKKANIVVAVGVLEAGAIGVLAIGNYFSQQALLQSGLLILPFCAGLWLGERWFRSKLTNFYQRMIFVTLMATGLIVALI